MSQLGHSRRFGDVQITSGFPRKRTTLDTVSMLKCTKSGLGVASLVQTRDWRSNDLEAFTERLIRALQGCGASIKRCLPNPLRAAEAFTFRPSA